MDENGLPITGAGVNYSMVEPINQRELITYFNMFIVRTCAFLNNFSTKCESKLYDLNNRLESIDTSLTLLETKLNSVEDLKDIKLETSNQAAAQQPQSDNLNAPPPPPSSSDTVQQQTSQPSAQPAPTQPEEPSQPVITVSQDERFAKYFRMLKFGIDEEAVRVKMKSEGVDPDLLKTPNAPAPPNEDKPEDGSDSDEEDFD